MNTTQFESLTRTLSQNGQKQCHEYQKLFGAIKLSKFVVNVIKSYNIEFLCRINCTDYQKQEQYSNYFDKIFPGTKWPFIFENQFLQCLKQLPNKYLNFATYAAIVYIADGNFETKTGLLNTVPKDNEYRIPFQQMFETRFQKLNIILYFDIYPQKIPRKQGNQIYGFEYVHIIRFFNIQCQSTLKEQVLTKILKDYQKNYTEDPYLIENKPIPSKEKQYPNHIGCLFEIKKSQNLDSSLKFLSIVDQNYIYVPNSFQFVKLEEQEQKEYIYDQKIQRWMSNELQNRIQTRADQKYEADSNKYIIKKYADFSSAAKLVELLQKIPNFRIKMTEEQKKIVGQSGDVIAIGRSGTGKTTCAILRLFSMDMLFKLRLNILQMNNSLSDLTNLFKTNNLKSIFITASPVLACEVKRFYKSLANNVYEQLAKKKNKIDQIKITKENLEESTFTIFEPENEDNTIQQDLEQEDYEPDDEEVKEYEREMGEFQQITDIKEFPAFLTLRKLLMLIDASLYNPFFSRNQTNQTIESKKRAQWHNESSGTMMINQYSDRAHNRSKIFQNDSDSDLEDDADQINASSIKKQEIVNCSQAREINFEIFNLMIWPKISNKNTNPMDLEADTVWNEIQQIIKGNELAIKQESGYLSKCTYQQYYRTFENAKVSDVAFELFLLYEKEKQLLGCYDLLDLVYYIQKQLDLNKHIFQKIHFLIIDEVQDLPKAVILLLNSIVDQGLFLAGDTAQNIVRGVGFKSKEVAQILKLAQKSKQQSYEISVHNLTINFRSHNNILQIANSVVNMLDSLFHKQIERMKKEISNKTGPKPMVFNCQNHETLFQFLSGTEADQTKDIEFGCNQVILVKDQESKYKIPHILQHALVLTVYEAKGLEFDDVILYNFFTDNYIGDNAWALLNNLEIRDIVLTKEEYESNIKKFGQQVLVQNVVEVDKGYKIKSLKLKPGFSSQQFNNYMVLCSELKKLYVAVTRPKTRLIIYDEMPWQRKHIQKLWEQLDLIQIITNDNINENLTKNDSIIQLDKDWKQQGIKMFRKGFYGQAVQCFKIANEQELMEKAQSYYFATDAANIEQRLEEINSQLQFVKSNAHPNINIKQLLLQQKSMQQAKNDLFLKAGQQFKSQGQLKRAAQCYFSGQCYELALEYYCQLDLPQEIAECHYFLENYNEASEYFQKSGDIMRALEAYEKNQNYSDLLKTLGKYKDQVNFELRLAYLNKYFPVILQQLTEKVEQSESENQIILEQNQQESCNEVIEEYNEENEQVSEESFEVQGDQSELASIQNNENNENNQTNSFLVQNKSQQQEKQCEIVLDQNSQVFNVDSSQSQFDHVSFYDPDDQWLQQDKQSIIKSIMSSNSERSDFSALFQTNNKNANIELVKTKPNIYAQETVMKELIQYFLAFSEEFIHYLRRQRSHSVLLSNRSDDEKEFDYMMDFMLDIDQIGIETIYLMLDILEQFKSYKLCIFVCNKYKLASKLGRYLICIAAEYSPLYQNSNKTSSQMITSPQIRKKLFDQSIIANYAIHNILESINPDFIKPKFENQQLTPFNYLGIQTYQQMISLGYWKKVLYQVDYKNALQLCESFQDWNNWKYLYLTNKLNMLDDNEVDLKKIYENLQSCFLQEYNYFDLFLHKDFQNDQKLAEISYLHYWSDLMTYLVQQQIITNTALNLKNQQIEKISPQILKIKLPDQFKTTEIVINAIQMDKELDLDVLAKLGNDGKVEENGLQTMEFLFLRKLLIIYLQKKKTKIYFQIQYLDHTIFHSLYEQLLKSCINWFQRVQIQQQSKINTQFQNKSYRKPKSIQIAKLNLLFNKISLPQGDSLENFKPCYVFLNIISPIIVQILNQFSENCLFVDINYEYVATHINTVEDQLNFIEQNYCKQIIEMRSQVLQEYYIQFDKSCIYQLSLSSEQQYNLCLELASLATLENYWQQIFNSKVIYHPNIKNNDYQAIRQNINQISKTPCSSFKNELNIILKDQKFRYLQQLPNQISSFLILQSLQQFEQSKKKFNHELIIQTIHLLHYSNNNSISYQLSEKICKISNKIPSYSKYIEFLECKEQKIMDDQIDCYLEYHYQFANIQNQFEANQNLIRLTLQYLIGLLSEDLLIPEDYIPYLQGLQISEDNVFSIDRVIHQVQNTESLDEILASIIENDQSNYGDEMFFMDRLLIATLIINVKQLPEILKRELNKQNTNPLANNIFSQVLEHLDDDIQKRKELFLRGNLISNFKFAMDYQFFRIKVNNLGSQEQLEKSYELCLKQWEFYQQLNEKLKFKANHLCRLLKLKWQNKFKQDVVTLQNYRKNFNNILINSKFQKLHLQYLRKSNFQILIQQITVLSTTLNKSQMLYQNIVDFHFVSQQQFRLQEAIDYLRKWLLIKETQDQIFKIESDFNQWRKMTHQTQTELEILEKNRKMLQIKWMTLKAGVKVRISKPKHRSKRI